MKMYTNTEFPFSLTMEDAAEKLRVQEEYIEEFEEIFQNCMKVARPKYRFAEVEVSQEDGKTIVGGQEFTSRIMFINMKDHTRAYPGVITCGRELYDLARSCDDVLEQFWVDGISELMLGFAGEAMRKHIREVCGNESIRAMAPGSLADFPITQQSRLFAMLDDPMTAIGLELTRENLMLPYKSGSAIYFVSEEHYENCSLCQREGCPNRRAPFDEKQFFEKFGLTEADAVQKVGV